MQEVVKHFAKATLFHENGRAWHRPESSVFPEGFSGYEAKVGRNKFYLCQNWIRKLLVPKLRTKKLPKKVQISLSKSGKPNVVIIRTSRNGWGRLFRLDPKIPKYTIDYKGNKDGFIEDLEWIAGCGDILREFNVEPGEWRLEVRRAS